MIDEQFHLQLFLQAKTHPSFLQDFLHTVTITNYIQLYNRVSTDKLLQRDQVHHLHVFNWKQKSSYNTLIELILLMHILI